MTIEQIKEKELILEEKIKGLGFDLIYDEDLQINLLGNFDDKVSRIIEENYKYVYSRPLDEDPTELGYYFVKPDLRIETGTYQSTGKPEQKDLPYDKDLKEYLTYKTMKVINEETIKHISLIKHNNIGKLVDPYTLSQYNKYDESARRYMTYLGFANNKDGGGLLEAVRNANKGGEITEFLQAVVNEKEFFNVISSIDLFGNIVILVSETIDMGEEVDKVIHVVLYDKENNVTTMESFNQHEI